MEGNGFDSLEFVIYLLFVIVDLAALNQTVDPKRIKVLIIYFKDSYLTPSNSLAERTAISEGALPAIICAIS